MRKAKILITLGPTSREPEVVEKLIAAGANGVRMNMSHGTHEEKAEDIARAREAAKKVGRPLAILVDLSGPKIRTRRLKDSQPVKLNAGSLFILTTEDIAGDENRVATNYPDLPRVVEPGTRLLLDDVLAQDRLIAVLSGAIGTMAVALACLGLFGLISYSVARRTNERAM